MAIDLLHAETIRTRLQTTLDRAVIAAADLDIAGDRDAVAEVVRDYFRREGLEDNLVSVDVAPQSGGRAVGAAATFSVDTFFLHFVGVAQLASASSAVAEEYVPNREISMVLDISGSMRRDDRITALKEAAKTFAGEVLDPTGLNRVSLNIVPYAGQVNIGPEMFDYLGGVRAGAGEGATENAFPEWPQDISNIVVYFDTRGDGDIDAAFKVEDFPEEGRRGFIGNDADAFFAPMVAAIRDAADGALDGAAVIGASIKGGRRRSASYFAVAGNANADDPDDGPTMNRGGSRNGVDMVDTASFGDLAIAGGGRSGPRAEASCIELSSADFDHSGLPDLGRYAQVPHFMNWRIAADVMDWGWCPEDDTAIRYAQNDESALRDFIDDLRMHDGTGTHYAMKYALALLDPASVPAFQHLSVAGAVPREYAGLRPAGWADSATSKYIVLMTDGQITDQIRPRDPADPRNATVELRLQGRNAGTTLSGRSTNLEDFYKVCDAARARGVTVFTIAYEAPSGAAREMRRCASSESHFFDANRANIGEVYAAIFSKINALRLIQ